MVGASQRRADVAHARRPAGSPMAARQCGEYLWLDRMDTMDGGSEIAEEEHDVVVSRVERDPRERARVNLSPLAHEGCLAIPGRRDHRGEPRRGRAQAPDNLRLRHGVGARKRCSEIDLSEAEWDLQNGQ
jgi:hypothetical protein